MLTRKIPLVLCSNYSMEKAHENPTHLFVFGDNLKRTGTGASSGQAVVRNAENSFGIVTKRAPSNNAEAFFSDKKEEFEAVKSDIAALAEELKTGKWEAVVFPVDGFGTGRAEMARRSPKIFAVMNSMLFYMAEHLLDGALPNVIARPKKNKAEEIASKGMDGESTTKSAPPKEIDEMDEVDILMRIPEMSREERVEEAMNPNISADVAMALACSDYKTNEALWFNSQVPQPVKDKLQEHFKQFRRLYDNVFFQGKKKTALFGKKALIEDSSRSAFLKQ